jgi:hypothetical protein
VVQHKFKLCCASAASRRLRSPPETRQKCDFEGTFSGDQWGLQHDDKIRARLPLLREGLATLALIRRQELDGFVEGLFGAEKTLDLRERAHRSLNVLGELRSLIAGVHDVAMDGSKPGGASDIEDTLQHMKQMTRIAESEMHAVLLSCKRARRDMLALLSARQPSEH